MFLQFDTLRAVPGLHHAVTTRGGGVSSGTYAALNLAFHVGEWSYNVSQNRQILARELGYDFKNLVAVQQVHGDGIQIVYDYDAGRGARDFQSAIPHTDALITDEKHLPLLILVADCAPILLVDPEKQVLAVAHAGWRGALAGIAGKVVSKMQLEFGSAPERILAGIGPCLCVENLEIGPEVAAQIARVDEAAIIGGWQKPHLDLRGLLQRDLQSAGVRGENIETMPFCPRDDVRFFSHRGQNGVAGRFGIVAFWE